MAVSDLPPERDPAKVRLLGALRVVSVMSISYYWSWELSDHMTPRELAMAFGQFLIEGGADAYPGAVRTGDLPGGRALPRSGKEWGRLIREHAPDYGESPDETLWGVIKDNLIAVTREAVWAFADACGYAAPSFWPRPASPAALPPSPPSPSPASPPEAVRDRVPDDSEVEILAAPPPAEELDQAKPKAAPGLAPTPQEFVEAYLARPGKHSIRGLLRARRDAGLDGTDGFGDKKLAAWWPKSEKKNRGGARSKG
jgi:hypothetical protein